VVNIQCITDLVSSRTLEKIQNYFTVATDISCVIRDHRGNKITKESKNTNLWKEVSKEPDIRKKSIMNFCEAMRKSAKKGDVVIYNHYLDTLSFVIPIHINNKIMGFFVGGLARERNPDIQVCTQESEKLGISLDSFLEKYLELPLVNESKMTACANLLKFIAVTLSTFAHEGNEAMKIKEDLEKEIAEKSLELQLAEYKYRNIFNSVIDGIFVADLNGIVKDINPSGARLLGYKRDELIGTNLRDLYVDPTTRDNYMERLLSAGRIELFHPFIRLKNGKTKYFETNASVLYDEHGNQIGIEGVFRDIDSREHKNIKQEEIIDVPTSTASKKSANK
jgi:PAS domain S-box-containing protein